MLASFRISISPIATLTSPSWSTGWAPAGPATANAIIAVADRAAKNLLVFFICSPLLGRRAALRATLLRARTAFPHFVVQNTRAEALTKSSNEPYEGVE